MSRRAIGSRIRLWVLLAWTGALVIGWCWSWVVYPDLVLPFGPTEVLIAIVGAFLAIRVRGNLLGPALVVGASAGLIYDIGTAYAAFSLERPSPLPATHLLAWLGTWTGPIAFVTVAVLFVLFPWGRFTRKTRWFIPLLSIPVVLTLVGAASIWSLPTHDLVFGAGSGSAELPPAAAAKYMMIDLGFILSLNVALPPSLVALLVRFWKADPSTRLQIKWVVASAIFAPLFIFTVVRLAPFMPVVVVYTVGASTVPVAIAIAVTRHRLYDLDRVVSRTVGYALVVGILGAAFALVVVFVPGWITGDEAPTWLVAISTLAMATAFSPVRKRVQHIVDRRFNRSRYDAEMVADRFAHSLDAGTDLETLVRGWVSVVRQTMEPSALGVWVRGRDDR